MKLLWYKYIKFIVMNLYLQCALISLIGLGLSILAVISSLTKKAKVANVVFNWGLFWKSDFLFQVVGTLLTVGLGLMLLGPALKKYPKYADADLIILLIFATIGYVGSDLASRLFSSVNHRINNAIDVKSDLADMATGTINAPTIAPKRDETQAIKEDIANGLPVKAPTGSVG